MTNCNRLELPFHNKTFLPRVANGVHSIILDIRESRYKRFVTYMSWDNVHCTGKPIYQSSFNLSVIKSGERLEKLAAKDTMLWFGIPLQEIVSTLSNECSCTPSFDDDDFDDNDYWNKLSSRRSPETRWNVEKWLKFDTNSCSGLPPTSASWLCKVLNGEFITFRTQWFMNAYQRTLLNSSFAQNVPINSPFLTRLPLDKYPNPARCTYQLWSSCGSYITKAIDDCEKSYHHVAHSLRDVCLLQRLYAVSKKTFNIDTCCPCLRKYAETYAHWADIPCQF
eukprot:gene1309-7937_t